MKWLWSAKELKRRRQLMHANKELADAEASYDAEVEEVGGYDHLTLNKLRDRLRARLLIRNELIQRPDCEEARRQGIGIPLEHMERTDLGVTDILTTDGHAWLRKELQKGRRATIEFYVKMILPIISIIVSVISLVVSLHKPAPQIFIVPNSAAPTATPSISSPSPNEANHH